MLDIKTSDICKKKNPTFPFRASGIRVCATIVAMTHCVVRVSHKQKVWLTRHTPGLLAAFFGGSPTYDLVLGGVQLPLPVQQCSSWTERTLIQKTTTNNNSAFSALCGALAAFFLSRYCIVHLAASLPECKRFGTA